MIAIKVPFSRYSKSINPTTCISWASQHHKHHLEHGVSQWEDGRWPWVWELASHLSLFQHILSALAGPAVYPWSKVAWWNQNAPSMGWFEGRASLKECLWWRSRVKRLKDGVDFFCEWWVYSWVFIIIHGAGNGHGKSYCSSSKFTKQPVNNIWLRNRLSFKDNDEPLGENMEEWMELGHSVSELFGKNRPMFGLKKSALECRGENDEYTEVYRPVGDDMSGMWAPVLN